MNLNWRKVIRSLRAQADDGIRKAEAIRQRMPKEASSGDVATVRAQQTIERHCINGNFCIALADALEAGLDE